MARSSQEKTMIIKLYVDQYGNKFYAPSLAELRKQIPGRVYPMYVDKKDGSTMRVGVVIGDHWLTEYIPNEQPVYDKTKTKYVEIKRELGKIRNGTKSHNYRNVLMKAEHIIDAARQAQHALEEMDLLVKDFMSNVDKCALQNPARLSNAPIMASDALSKLRALLGETGQ